MVSGGAIRMQFGCPPEPPRARLMESPRASHSLVSATPFRHRRLTGLAVLDELDPAQQPQAADVADQLVARLQFAQMRQQPPARRARARTRRRSGSVHWVSTSAIPIPGSPPGDALDDEVASSTALSGARRTPSVGIPAASPAATPGAESSTTTQRSHAEPLRREQEHVRRRLAVLHLVAGDRDANARPGLRQRAVQPLAHAEEATAIGDRRARAARATAVSASAKGSSRASMSANSSPESTGQTRSASGSGARSAKIRVRARVGRPSRPPRSASVTA